MRKLILTERQYGKLKNLIIESEITKSFLIEQNFSIDRKLLMEKSYAITLKKRDGWNSGGLKPKDVLTKVKVKNYNSDLVELDVTFESGGGIDVSFDCKTPDVMVIGGDGQMSGSEYRVDEKFKNLVKWYCKGKPKKNQKDAKKINQGGGKEGDKKTYTQIWDQTVKYKSVVNNQMVDLKIPKNTIYTSIPEKNGVSFSFKIQEKPIYGWFGCKSKKFIINKSPVTDEKQDLTKKLFDKLCVKDSSKPEEVLYKGGGSSDTSVSSFDISQFDQYI
jgi:hypothetical protein